MTSARSISAALLCVWLAATVTAADEPAPKHHMSDEVKARMLEEAKKKQPAPAPAETAKKDPAATASNPNSTGPKTPTPTSAAKPEKETPTVMPQVEVRNSRITELDQKIAKQEQEIAREKQNTKPTEVDKALNAPKISKALSIFGGESSDQRATVSSERVRLMQDEKELLEMMKTAKTKEEKAALQKELEELRAYRRELEKALR